MRQSLRACKSQLDHRAKDAFEQLYNMECWQPVELPRSIINIIEEANQEKTEILPWIKEKH